jgi:hypothetical protein
MQRHLKGFLLENADNAHDRLRHGPWSGHRRPNVCTPKKSALAAVSRNQKLQK